MSVKRTVREKKFVKEYIKNGGNSAQAYRDAFRYKGKNAHKLGPRMLAKVGISDEEIMIGIGLTDNYLYEKLKEGTEATKVTKDGDEVEDYAVRHQYIDTTFKLRKKYSAEKHEHVFPDVVEIKHYVQVGKPEIKEERNGDTNSNKTG